MDSQGYKSLPFFKQTEIIYDFTVEFTKRYIDYKSRTKDQMEQAARSGKQNIPEGYLQRKVMICLINQTNNLLDQKLRWLEQKFIKEGGFRENLFKKRMDFKKSQ